MQTILRALGLLSESTQLNSNQEMPLSDFPLLNTPPPKKPFYAVKRTSGTPNHGLLPLDFVLNVQPFRNGHL